MVSSIYTAARTNDISITVTVRIRPVRILDPRLDPLPRTRTQPL